MYTQDSRQYNTVQGGATPSMYVQERLHYDQSQRASYEQWQSSDWTTASNQVSSVIAGMIYSQSIYTYIQYNVSFDGFH